MQLEELEKANEEVGPRSSLVEETDDFDGKPTCYVLRIYHPQGDQRKVIAEKMYFDPDGRYSGAKFNTLMKYFAERYKPMAVTVTPVTDIRELIPIIPERPAVKGSITVSCNGEVQRAFKDFLQADFAYTSARNNFVSEVMKLYPGYEWTKTHHCGDSLVIEMKEKR